MRSPVFTDIFFEVQVSSLTLTWPCDMRVCTRDRDKSGIWFDSQISNR